MSDQPACPALPPRFLGLVHKSGFKFHVKGTFLQFDRDFRASVSSRRSRSEPRSSSRGLDSEEFTEDRFLRSMSSPKSRARTSMNQFQDPLKHDSASDATEETHCEASDATSQSGSETLERTTLMVKNLPSSYLRDGLRKLLENLGFKGEFDFVHVPVDCFSGAGLGYAFLNLETKELADKAFAVLQGYSKWGTKSRKVLAVCWGEEQGLEPLIERYRNHRMMHRSVPAIYRPLLLRNGEPIEFPAPTKTIQKPRCLPCRR